MSLLDQSSSDFYLLVSYLLSEFERESCANLPSESPVLNFRFLEEINAISICRYLRKFFFPKESSRNFHSYLRKYVLIQFSFACFNIYFFSNVWIRTIIYHVFEIISEYFLGGEIMWKVSYLSYETRFIDYIWVINRRKTKWECCLRIQHTQKLIWGKQRCSLPV
jgi:hypothetical protein